MGVVSGRGFDWGSLHAEDFGFPCEYCAKIAIQSKNVFSDLSFYMIPLMWWITPPKTTPILPNIIIKAAPAYM